MKNSNKTTPKINKLKQSMFFSLTVAATIFMAGCGKVETLPMTDATASVNSVNDVADKIQVKLRIDNNYQSEGCPNDAVSCYQATMTLSLPANMPSNWRIIFSHLSPISKVISNEFDLIHINGDLHQITSKKADIQADTAYEIVFYGNTPLVSESVLFPNYLLVAGNGESTVISSTTEKLIDGHQVPRPQHVEAFTRPEQLLRTADDKVIIADAGERFARFSSRQANNKVDSEFRIIPQVFEAKWSGDSVELSSGVRLPAMPANTDEHFAAAISQRFNANALHIDSQGLVINATHKNDAIAESYSLLIGRNDIQVEYADTAGFYYAMMSIAQLYDAKTHSLPLGVVTDQPSMEFRGLHIDVARNFRSKDFILKTLDQMSYFKLNKLHLHLADDEGWRLQIESLPELTDVGAFRCFDETEQGCLMPQLAGGNGKLAATERNSGFYSAKDYIEILQYADTRQIEVIPSLDMPGHSRAAMVSMNARYNRLIKEEKPDDAKRYLLTEFEDESRYSSIQNYNDNTLNPCLPATYTFIEEVLKQLITMHKSADVPLQRYHIGADETAGAWADSPACIALIANNDSISEAKQLGPYFIEKVANFVAELDVVPAAWSDGLSHSNAKNLPEKLQSNAWETLYQDGHSNVHTMLNKGWEVVLSTPDVLYFDFPYEADPIEPGYYWGSRYTDSYQVFQFMPNNLPVHAEIWQDKFGENYEATASVDIQGNGRISGIQAQLWSESVRSNEQANYMLFPRLLAVAERAWHSPNWSEKYQPGVSYSSVTGHFDSEQEAAMLKDWLNFNHVLSTKAMPQLVNEGIEPRVPLPGAILKEGMLHMNTDFSGLQLEYKLPNKNWQLYENPINHGTQGDIRVRAKIPETQVTSREQLISISEN
jgi:hexosaminidase